MRGEIKGSTYSKPHSSGALTHTLEKDFDISLPPFSVYERNLSLGPTQQHEARICNSILCLQGEQYQ